MNSNRGAVSTRNLIHHALMDGIHMAKFYARVEDHLQHPEALADTR